MQFRWQMSGGSEVLPSVNVYYASLRTVYDAAVESYDRSRRSERISSLTASAMMWLAGLTVFPVLPLALTYLADRYSIAVLSFQVRFAFGPFVVVWLITVVVVAAVIALLVLVESVLLPQTLWDSSTSPVSGEQLSFLAAYEANEQLKVYFVSHIDAHVDNCLHGCAVSFPLKPTTTSPRTHM